MLLVSGRHTLARVPSNKLVLKHTLVNVVVGVGFSEHSCVYAHDSEHIFRTETKCERYRVHAKSF